MQALARVRLIQMLKEHAAQEPHTRWECQSWEYYQNTALFPIMDLFQRILRFETSETLLTQKLEKLEHALSQYRLPLEDTVPLFAPLLSLPVPENRYPLLNLSPQRQRQKTLETIVAILLELAERQPLLFILEDLHWADPTTLELLNLLIDQIPTASILVLLTCRPYFQPCLASPFVYYRNDVEPLISCPGGTDCHRHYPWKNLPNRGASADHCQDGWRAALCGRNHQSPVGIRAPEESRMDTTTSRGRSPHSTIPATLQDSLMARLDRLVTAKAVAQYAAVIGRRFSYELLHAVSHVDEASVTA